MHQLCKPSHIQISRTRIAQQDQIARHKADDRQFSPFFTNGETEHPKVQDRHINKQHKITSHTVTDKER